MAETEYFETLAEVAEFLGMPLDELCRKRSVGTFPILPRAKDSTPVYFVADLDKWVKAGKPFGPGWAKGVL
ncbi:MAG TPA: hypothetical protein VJJ98_03805 [Sedimentisphaerales bacterium]|nr:hypothetical protein [Sedimentisphaerales bacterium]